MKGIPERCAPKILSTRTRQGLKNLGVHRQKTSQQSRQQTRSPWDHKGQGFWYGDFCFLGFKKLALAIFLRYKQLHQNFFFLVFLCAVAVFLSNGRHLTERFGL